MKTNRKYQLLILSALQISLLFFPNSSSIYGQDYIIKNYNTSDGLVQSFVIDIFNDPRGFIWIVTNEGISRFDGFEFLNFRESNEFFNTYPERASVDSLGTIYIRNRENQIWKWNGRDFKKLQLPEGFPGLRVASMKIHGRKDLIVATFANGLFIFSGNKWQNYTTKDGLYSDSLSHVSEYLNGATYIATSKGVCKFKNGLITKIFPTNNLMINTILPDKKGNLWITAIEKGIKLYDGKELKEVYSPPGLTTPNGYVDLEDNLWFATLAGLMRFEIRPDSNIKRTLVIDEPTSTVSIDKENNIWAGTVRNGIYKITRNPFKSYTIKDGLPSNMVYPVREDKAGVIWAGTEIGMAKFEGDRWSQNSIIPEIKSSFVKRINKDINGNLHIAADNILLNYDGKKFEYLIGKNEFTYNITGYIEEENGTKWIGTTENGIWYNKSEQWEQLQLPGLNPNIFITSLLIDKSGAIWGCSRHDGLLSIGNDAVRQIDISKGMTSNAVIDIDEDNDGNIWTATLGGVSVIKDSTVTNTFTFEDGLITNACYAVMCAGNMVYIGTAGGLNIYDGKNFLVFTSEDGMINNDINSSSFLKDSKNNIWFGTVGGITLLKIDPILNRLQNAEPFIKSISASGTTFTYLTPDDVKYAVQFKPGNNNIRIDFAGIGFNSLQNIFFEYMLSNNNESWINVGNQRFAEFNDLPPGDYYFSLRIKQFMKNEKPVTTSISFTIKPFFFQTAWFRLLIALLIIIALIGVIIRKRTAPSKKKIFKYSTSSLSDDKYNKILEHLTQRVKKEKQYLELEFNLKKLADEMNVPKEHLSEVINKEYKVNFNDYINKLRIEEAKILFMKTGNKSTILEIALAVGFNSKSTFNSAFRKFTGMTPSEFKSAGNY